MVMEPDWMNMLMDRAENKVTALKLTKCGFAPAGHSVLLFLLMRFANIKTDKHFDWLQS